MHDWELFNALASADAELTGIPFDPLPAPRELLAGMIANDPRVDIDTLLSSPHGIDLGPLEANTLVSRLCTDDQAICLIPEAIPSDIDRLHNTLAHTDEHFDLRLIGRRHVRSNNSWMHNSHRLTKGPRRDQLLMHPDDLVARNLSDGDEVSISSRVGSIRVSVSASTDMMKGSVSLPHGWGHQRAGVRMGVANALPGASANDITDERFLDTLSGNTALNGVPVKVEA